ncbi:hypothetical protein [Paenibacillus hamazuiensis]|nr:hypothetical protein [Paenibacillus hamazuiensis]
MSRKEEQQDRQREEETMSFHDSCADAGLGQVDVPADAIADKEEYVDEP